MNLKSKDSAKPKIQPQSSGKKTVSNEVGNYEKHPFFVRKAAAAKQLLIKVGLPKELAKKSHV
jgi:hypothetical protein